MTDAASGVLVIVNVVESDGLATDAVTVNPPALVLAVSVAEAKPLALVSAVVLALPPNVPLTAPLATAVKVTVIPLAGLLLASFTVTCNGWL